VVWRSDAIPQVGMDVAFGYVYFRHDLYFWWLLIIIIKFIASMKISKSTFIIESEEESTDKQQTQFNCRKTPPSQSTRRCSLKELFCLKCLLWRQIQRGTLSFPARFYFYSLKTGNVFWKSQKIGWLPSQWIHIIKLLIPSESALQELSNEWSCL
jgi:hypothetical protein